MSSGAAQRAIDRFESWIAEEEKFHLQNQQLIAEIHSNLESLRQLNPPWWRLDLRVKMTQFAKKELNLEQQQGAIQRRIRDYQSVIAALKMGDAVPAIVQMDQVVELVRQWRYADSVLSEDAIINIRQLQESLRANSPGKTLPTLDPV